MTQFPVPMKPSPLLSLPSESELRQDWVVQPKAWGWAAVLWQGRIYTRHGKEITDWEGLEALRGLQSPFPIHGELVNLEQRGEHGVPRLKHGGEPLFWAFDAMVEGAPLVRRLAMLLAWFLAKSTPHRVPLQIIPTFRVTSYSALTHALHTALASGHEGLVIKRADSLYHIGELVPVVTPDWIKIKEEVVYEGAIHTGSSIGASQPYLVSVGES